MSDPVSSDIMMMLLMTMMIFFFLMMLSVELMREMTKFLMKMMRPQVANVALKRPRSSSMRFDVNGWIDKMRMKIFLR